MSKRLKILVPLVILLSAAFALMGVNYVKETQTSNQEIHRNDVHFHAGFQVYIDGKLQDFTGNEFMHEAPCTIDGEPIENELGDEQTEIAHLHDHTGDVVHVHRKEAVWGDLFQNIKYKFPEDKNITAFAHGEKIENILEYPIIPNDTVVLLIGEHNDPEKNLEDSVTMERIGEVEQKSETCSS